MRPARSDPLSGRRPRGKPDRVQRGRLGLDSLKGKLGALRLEDRQRRVPSGKRASSSVKTRRTGKTLSPAEMGTTVSSEELA